MDNRPESADASAGNAPLRDDAQPGHPEDRRQRKRLFWGLALVAMGFAFLFDIQGIIDIGEIWRLWPFLLVIQGAADIIGGRTVDDTVKGGFHIVVGLWLYACIEHLWGFSFRTTWPVVLIAYGIGAIAAGSINLYKRGGKESSR